MRTLTVGDLMTSPIKNLDVNTSVNEAAKHMSDKAIHRVLVIEDGKLFGILSIPDLVAGVAVQEEINRETVGEVISSLPWHAPVRSGNEKHR